MSSATPMQKSQPDPVAIFISDLHLQQSHPETRQAFFDFLRLHAIKARQLYLLGDLFEYWVGDDDVSDPFNAAVVTAIRQVSEAGIEIFWMAGNRDFLVGNDFAQAAGLTLLPDPAVVNIAGLKIALAHGDAQCTDDVSYMAFRAMVRQPEWQQEFLAKPLAQRKAVVAAMRSDSREAQKSKTYDIMDVNAEAIQRLFRESATSIMIHGHTHRPARHEYKLDASHAATRYVLPDWECDGGVERGGWISIDADGTVNRYDTKAKKLPW